MSALGRTLPGPPDRVAYIDGLRGLAALSVLAFHATHYLCKGLPRDNLAAFVFRLGTYGVDLFFVLSGFCLAYPLLRKAQGIDLVRFASRRIVRILPPYYAAIVVLAIALIVSGSPPDPFNVLTQALFLDRDAHFLSVTFWTLPIEIRWYVLFPLVLWLWTVAPRAFFVVAAGAVIAFQLTTAGAMDLYALPAFMLGIVAADMAMREQLPVKKIALVAGALLAAALVLDWFSGPPALYPPVIGVDVREALPPLRVVWQLAAFACVLLATCSPVVQRVFAWRPLAFAGTASYSIYLIHVPVVQAVHVYFGSLAPVWGSVLAAVLGLAAGFAFWRLVEFPFTETALKGVALARVEPFVARIFDLLRLPRALPLGHETVPAPALVPALAPLEQHVA